jgi:hypothetical protein
MPWPDIFFKTRKPNPEPALPPPFTPAIVAEAPPPPVATPTAVPTPTPVPARLQPPTIKPLPAALEPKVMATPAPAKITPVVKGTGTRTLPAMHGVVLRAPVQQATRTMKIPSAVPRQPAAPIKNIEQLMAEADPVRTLSQTGSVRMLKRLAPEPGSTETAAPPAAANLPPPLSDPATSAATPPSLPSFSTSPASIADTAPLHAPPIPPPADTTPVLKPTGGGGGGGGGGHAVP